MCIDLHIDSTYINRDAMSEKTFQVAPVSTERFFVVYRSLL